MIFYFNFFDNIVNLFTYLFVYNFSLFLIFWTLQQFISSNFKTIYSFSDLKLNGFFTFTVTIALLSMAGVPPFAGFFAKILILISLVNSNFFLFYLFFFILLFLGLYFYVQNIRFLYSTGPSKIEYAHTINVRVSSFYYYYSTFFLFFLIFSFVFFDDIILYFSWILS